MENNDFSFMKSGFNALQASEEDENMKQNVVGTIVHFTENALKTAGFYTKHAKRDIITSEDIKRCFMLEVFLFFKRENLQENIENVIEELFNETSDEDDEIELGEEKQDSSEENEIIFEEDIEATFKLSNCNCLMCNTLNNIYDKWNSWTPETPMQEILQRHINNM